MTKQLIWLSTNSCFVCSNIYSVYAHCFVKYAVLSFWNININFSYINIRPKNVLRDIMFYEVLILRTKRRSTGKMLTGKTFCGVCLYVHQALYDGKKSVKFKFTAIFVF